MKYTQNDNTIQRERKINNNLSIQFKNVEFLRISSAVAANEKKIRFVSESVTCKKLCSIKAFYCAHKVSALRAI